MIPLLDWSKYIYIQPLTLLGVQVVCSFYCKCFSSWKRSEDSSFLEVAEDFIIICQGLIHAVPRYCRNNFMFQLRVVWADRAVDIEIQVIYMTSPVLGVHLNLLFDTINDVDADSAISGKHCQYCRRTHTTRCAEMAEPLLEKMAFDEKARRKDSLQ